MHNYSDKQNFIDNYTFCPSIIYKYIRCKNTNVDQLTNYPLWFPKSRINKVAKKVRGPSRQQTAPCLQMWSSRITILCIESPSLNSSLRYSSPTRNVPQRKLAKRTSNHPEKKIRREARRKHKLEETSITIHLPYGQMPVS